MVKTAKTSVKPVPPFDFELSALVFSKGDPQIRTYQNETFRQVIRVDGKLILASVTSAGTVDKPRLTVNLISNRVVRRHDVEKTKGIVCAMFNLGFDLEPFYNHVKRDSVMTRLTKKLRGLRSPVTATAFEALVDSIVEQQISLSLANKMEERLIKEFGEKLILGKEIYYAFPTPRELASVSVDRLRRIGLSQRKSEFIRTIAKMNDDGSLNFEKLSRYENPDDIIKELDCIRGVGVWTAELTMVRGMQRLEAFPAEDLGLRRAVSHYYRRDEKISEQEARLIAEKWGAWKGLAGFYLIVALALDLKIC